MLSQQVRAILTIVVLGTFGTGQTDAAEPLQRTFRFFGIGWGDGYHACARGGCRPGADLPPASFYTQYGQRHVGVGGEIVHPFGAPTLYSLADQSYGVGGTKYPRFCDGTGSVGNGRCDSAPPMVVPPPVQHAQPSTPMPRQPISSTNPRSIPTPPHSPTPTAVPATPADGNGESLDSEPVLLDEYDLEEEPNPTSPSDDLLGYAEFQQRLQARLVSQMRQAQRQNAARPETQHRAPPAASQPTQNYRMPVHPNQPMVRQVPYRIPTR